MPFRFCRVASNADLAAPELRRLLTSGCRIFCRWFEIAAREETADPREYRVDLLIVEWLEPLSAPPLAFSALEVVVRDDRAGPELSELAELELLAVARSARLLLFGNGPRV